MQLMHMAVPWSRIGIFRNEHTRSTPLDHKLMFLCISYYLSAFGTVCFALRKSVQNGPNLCKSSCHEVASEFFATNTPDPPYWTINLCFGVIHTIWVHFGPFGWLTKLRAKRAKLVQKFVPKSRGGIFHNECTRSTPLDPKLMFFSFCTI